MKEAAISVRIDAETKNKVEEIFKKLGISHSSAISLFYNQVILNNGLPFDTKLGKANSANNQMFVSEPLLEYGSDKSIKEAIVKLALKYLKEEENIEEKKESINRKDILKKLKNAKKKYEKEGFLIVGLFGSYARNEADIKSDVDIVYELTPDFRKKHKGFKAISQIDKIKKELEKFLGTKVDLVDKSTQIKNKKSRILNEVIYV